MHDAQIFRRPSLRTYQIAFKRILALLVFALRDQLVISLGGFRAPGRAIAPLDLSIEVFLHTGEGLTEESVGGTAIWHHGINHPRRDFQCTTWNEAK